MSSLCSIFVFSMSNWHPLPKRTLIVAASPQVGAGDPHSVVFHLPGETSHIRAGKSIDIACAMEISSNMDTCISEELLVVLMKFLKKYLMDDSVKIVDMASQTLRVSASNWQMAFD